MTSLLTVLTLLAVLSGGFCQNRVYRSVLSVNNGGQWGDWHNADMCPENYYAIGFSLRVEGFQGDGDDTALNGIRLYCSTDNRHGYIPTVESHNGFWGDWTSPQYCPTGVLTAFQLRVEPPIGSGDDTAANNIKFQCSSNRILEGQGKGWGDYGGWSNTCYDGGICGIKTKVEEVLGGGGDDTALNDVHFYCCDK
ncbi:vitelline membrane outer layer protein 1 homolog [Cheilinus undulatus]|uniref:vitelline membrane outer layer protein 1 homolog n=1 Tax=Cheilinus undulatus TaxID=241271 RepID=UPI001BD6BEC5|nr:vitelline membrane outer layer protein 1 homolog [Cheilinus undulatus]